MWQSPTPINRHGRQLSAVEAWIHLFARAWERLEHDPEELYLDGFDAFGAAVASTHGDENPATVAKRLYPDAGEYMPDLYPGYRMPVIVKAPPPPPDWTRVREEDVAYEILVFPDVELPRKSTSARRKGGPMVDAIRPRAQLRRSV